MFLNLAINSEYSSTKSVFELIGLLAVCILVFVASYYVTKFVGKKQKGTLEKGNFKNIEIYRVSPNKYIQIIQIGKRYVVISVTKDGIDFLMELNEEDIITWPDEVQKLSFKDVFANLKNKGKANENMNELTDLSSFTNENDDTNKDDN